jgi:hypothetical protein
MFDSAPHPSQQPSGILTQRLHAGARRDLARALTLLAMAARRAPAAGSPLIFGDAAAEGLAGAPSPARLEALIAAPEALAGALVAQGWRREVAGGFVFTHPATGLKLALDVPATNGLEDLAPAVLLDVGGGLTVACRP